VSYAVGYARHRIAQMHGRYHLPARWTRCTPPRSGFDAHSPLVEPTEFQPPEVDALFVRDRLVPNQRVVR
jgi:hypothetical protein